VVFMKLFLDLFCCSVCLIANRLHLLEGQAGVKFILLFEAWLKIVDRWSSCGSGSSRCARTRSKKYETARTSDNFSSEDFQNTGTFIVVRSSVFVVSSAQKTHLARDAYNALWDSCRPGQERNCAPEFHEDRR